MTVAATNFLAAMTGGISVADAAAIPTEGFSTAIDVALAEPVATPLAVGDVSIPPPQPTLTIEPMIAAEFDFGEQASEAPAVPVADVAEPELAQGAARLPLLLKPTVCASPETIVKPQVSLLLDAPVADTTVRDEDPTQAAAPPPEPTTPKLHVVDEKAPIAAAWIPQIKSVPTRKGYALPHARRRRRTRSPRRRPHWQAPWSQPASPIA